MVPKLVLGMISWIKCFETFYIFVFFFFKKKKKINFKKILRLCYVHITIVLHHLAFFEPVRLWFSSPSAIVTDAAKFTFGQMHFCLFHRHIFRMNSTKVTQNKLFFFPRYFWQFYHRDKTALARVPNLICHLFTKFPYDVR